MLILAEMNESHLKTRRSLVNEQVQAYFKLHWMENLTPSEFSLSSAYVNLNMKWNEKPKADKEDTKTWCHKQKFISAQLEICFRFGLVNTKCSKLKCRSSEISKPGNVNTRSWLGFLWFCDSLPCSFILFYFELYCAQLLVFTPLSVFNLLRNLNLSE